MPTTSNIGPQIKRFLVEGLFGRHKLELKFKDNRIIIVGENGIGKSTIVNMLYHLLTCQWSKLQAAPFSRITLELNDDIVEVEKDKFSETSANPTWFHDLALELYSRMPQHRADSIIEDLKNIDDGMDFQQFLTHASLHTGLSLRQLGRLGRTSPVKNRREFNKYRESLTATIESNVKCQILFLPTYRRIERDLQTLFPDLSMERELRRWNRNRNPQRKGGYLELVEFGMQDVEDAFKDTTQRLDRKFRAELNNLNGEYLREIIRSQHQNVTADQFLAPEVPGMVNDILSRMDDQILPKDEQDELIKLIKTVQMERNVNDKQRVVLHFVSKLIRIHEEQKRREERVTKLVAVCNRYLTDKNLQFDSQQFDLYISRGKEPSQDTERIPASVLSSGEKQIVSLFTHIYLSDVSGYFVMIDEPELSISVPWQRTFLEDIVETGLCHGLVAVTHSPFIFDNKLNDYARSMSEFMQ